MLWFLRLWNLFKLSLICLSINKLRIFNQEQNPSINVLPESNKMFKYQPVCYLYQVILRLIVLVITILFNK